MFLNLTIQERKVIFLSSLGGALEFYDFVIYMFFASILDQLFFPNKDKLHALMAVFAVFAIGYLIRPLGGMLFGHYGDKYGRKTTFVVTVMLMAIPTFLIGLLPTDKTIGTLAAVLLVLLRILQGLAVGGEIPGAITFASEHVNPKYRGFTCGIIFFGLNMGMILGSLVSVVLYHSLDQKQLLQWGWRVPFLLGGILGLVSYQLRKHLTETPLFSQLQPAKSPIYLVFRYHLLKMLRSIGLTWLGAVIVCLLFLYFPTYLTEVLHYPKDFVSSMTTLNLVVFSLLAMVTGWLSDKIGRKCLLRFGALSILVCSYGLFYLLTWHNIYIMEAVLLSFAILSSTITGSFPIAIVELFPTNSRYTGLAIAYNIAFAVFGGLAPLLATYLIQLTQNVLAPSYYLMISASICLLATINLPDYHGQPLPN